MSLFQKSYQLFDRLAVRLGSRISFSDSYNPGQMLKDGGKSILDVGCGEGGAMASVNRSHRFTFVVGVDIYPEAERHSLNATYSVLIGE